MSDTNRPFNWWYLIGPVIGLAVVVWFFLGRTPKPVEAPPEEGFDIAKVPEDKEQPVETYVSDFEKQRDEWKQQGGPGLRGFRPEGDMKFQAEAGQTPSGSGTGPGTPGRKDPAQEAAKEREIESVFMQKYRALMEAERRQINGIARKYFKTQPIIQQMNKDFDRAHMPRYMAAHDKLRKDGNIYQFARDALSLPEVRDGIKKYIMNPESMKVGLQMLAELLSTKPPKPLYDETFRFLAADQQVSAYMGKEFWPTVTPRLPAALMSAPISDAQRTDISNIAGEMAGAKIGAPNLTGVRK